MIKLFNNYEILVSNFSYTVVKNNGKKTTEEKDKTTGEIKKVEKINYSPVGDYTNLESALNGARKEMIKQNLKDGEFTLNEALNIVRELNRKFDEIISNGMEDK